MKKPIFIGVLAAVVLSATTYANPPCPRAADHLEDFAYCLRPFPNGKGQVLAGQATGGVDHHTTGLMNSMHRTISMPQVYPNIPAAVSFASNMMTAAYVSYKWPYSNRWNPTLWWWMYYP